MIIKKIRKIATSVKAICTDPLIVNAYVKFQDGRVISWNWGDDINYHFLKYLTKRNIEIYFEAPIAMVLRRKNYLCIGSTLNYLTTEQTVVWGAGVVDSNLEMRASPAQVLAVRGPLSRDYLLSRGIECPEVYGDPALLIPYFYRPTPSDRPPVRKIGVVPHYADLQSPMIAALQHEYPELQILDIANYGGWTDFVDAICACDAIFSSSLHGLIVAEAYAIPNYWIRISDKVIGNGFKFRDYFASIGKENPSPINLNAVPDLAELMANHEWNPGRIALGNLLEACPFTIREEVRYEHPLDL